MKYNPAWRTNVPKLSPAETVELPCQNCNPTSPVNISFAQKELQWLPIRQRIEYKIMVTTFKAIHGPKYYIHMQSQKANYMNQTVITHPKFKREYHTCYSVLLLCFLDPIIWLHMCCRIFSNCYSSNVIKYGFVIAEDILRSSSSICFLQNFGMWANDLIHVCP